MKKLLLYPSAKTGDSFTVPATVIEIGESALSNAPIKAILVEKGNENFTSQDGVLYTSFTHSTYSAYETLLSGARIVAVVLIAIAMAIGLVIVVNTSQTNLLEQKKELCVLRTLGFQHREISRYWFFQSILHFLVSSVFGFPAGIELAKSTLRQLETANRSYPFSNSLMDYALTALSVLGYIALSHFLTMRALKGWEIVEVVKEKE